MPRNYILISAVALAFAGAGCASNHASSRVASASLLRTPTSEDPGRETAAKLGQSAIVWGDKHTATNLFVRAEKENSTPLNRFNLATVYQQTGRTGDAMEIYATVAADGKNTFGRSLNPADDRELRTRSFNLAEESQKRMTAIIDRARTGPTAATGDDSPAPMSDLAAAALDAIENPLVPVPLVAEISPLSPSAGEIGVVGQTPG